MQVSDFSFVEDSHDKLRKAVAKFQTFARRVSRFDFSQAALPLCQHVLRQGCSLVKS